MANALIIAIDGPTGVGKSSAAKSLATRLGFLYLESGLLYRAVAWKVKHEGVDPKDHQALQSLCQRIDISIKNINGLPRVLVGDKDVTDDLKTSDLDRLSSIISAAAPVRERLFQLQRDIGAHGRVIVEGRDIGSVVFPDADLKFFLDAQETTRANRRYTEMRQRGLEASLENVQTEIQLRDQRDTRRDLAPLKRAEDAIYIDTTHLTLDQVVDRMVGEFNKRLRP